MSKRQQSLDKIPSQPMRDDAMLEVQDLKMHFPIRAGFLRRVVGQVKAVDGVNLFIRPGETLGLVGESGCGKTTTGRCIIRAYDPAGGRILYRREDGQVVDLAPMDNQSLKLYHRQIRLIFQDPYSSLNPRMPVLDLVGDTNSFGWGLAYTSVGLAALVAPLAMRYMGLKDEHRTSNVQHPTLNLKS